MRQSKLSRAFTLIEPRFELTPVRGKIVSAPLSAECLANIECEIAGASGSPSFRRAPSSRAELP